jgi:flagellar hook-associated protein 1 FlgK
VDLFSRLTSVTRALDAQRYGLDVAGQNIANVNTPGYSRRTIDMAALAPEGPGTAGRGVEVLGVRALRDRLLEARLYNEVPAQTREAAMAEALSIVEAAIGTPGSSIDTNLEKFYDSFAMLSETPTSAAERENVIIAGDNLAASFRDMASRIESARQDADRQIRGTVDDINSLVERIAALNVSIGSATSAERSLHVRDEQFELVRQLSELVDVRVLNRSEGGVDISVGGGRPLIVGETAYQIQVQSAPPSGYATLQVNGAAVNGEINGGRLGGFLRVRDVNIPDYTSRLDTLAYEVATQVNALHAAGYDQTGATGGAFFDFSTAPVGSVGAAAALRLRPAVAADSRLVAAGSTTAAGDNDTARAIAGLRDALVIGGNTTLSDAWGQLVYRVARDSKTAADERDSRTEIVRQVDTLRDAVSGVSLDEEAMHLLKFQRAYEANARFFQVIDRSLEMLLQMAGN